MLPLTTRYGRICPLSFRGHSVLDSQENTQTTHRLQLPAYNQTKMWFVPSLYFALYLLVVPQQSAATIIFHNYCQCRAGVSVSAQGNDAVLCSPESRKRCFSVTGTPQLVAWVWRAWEMGHKHGYFYNRGPIQPFSEAEVGTSAQWPTFENRLLQAIPSPPVRQTSAHLLHSGDLQNVDGLGRRIPDRAPWERHEIAFVDRRERHRETDGDNFLQLLAT